MAIDRPWCVVTLLLILFVLHHSPALNPINSEKLRVLDLKIEMRKRRSSVTATLNEDFLLEAAVAYVTSTRCFDLLTLSRQWRK